MMTVEEAITGRRCIRAFLPKPVPRELIERIMAIAGRAPSGSNIQPWKVWVLDGAVRDEICRDLVQRYDSAPLPTRNYNYYPEKWFEPYLARRRACGFGLYNTIGIPRGDKARMREQSWVNWATVTDLAGVLVTRRDLPWRTAHQIVGIMVRLCEERRLGPADVTPALLDEVAAHFDAARRAALFDEILALGAQAWMTGTDTPAFSALAGKAVFARVERGLVRTETPRFG